LWRGEQKSLKGAANGSVRGPAAVRVRRGSDHRLRALSQRGKGPTAFYGRHNSGPAEDVVGKKKADGGPRKFHAAGGTQPSYFSSFSTAGFRKKGRKGARLRGWGKPPTQLSGTEGGDLHLLKGGTQSERDGLERSKGKGSLHCRTRGKDINRRSPSVRSRS